MQNPRDIFPAAFIERLDKLFSTAQVEQILASFCSERHTTLRANTLKISADELFTQLTEAGIALEKVPWWENAFVVKDLALRQVHHPLYVEGALYVQSLSSMIPPLVLDPQPNEKILDLTAAPGSKTTQTAAMMNNTGEIVANDLSPIRLFKLQANLKAQGVTNTFARKGPGQYLWEKYPEYFDRTLVDVPCGMEGRFSCLDAETYEDWSVKKIKELSMRQCHLLRSAVTATKPGGVIIYSTCTLAPEENEAVVNWLLEKEGDAVELESIEIPHLEMTPGITEWEGKSYHPTLAQTARILPSEKMEGFFVAKIRKLRSSVPVPQPQKFNKFSRHSHGGQRNFKKNKYKK
jgi:NOL1/NOP2/sun family putative RNA methylase